MNKNRRHFLDNGRSKSSHVELTLAADRWDSLFGGLKSSRIIKHLITASISCQSYDKAAQPQKTVCPPFVWTTWQNKPVRLWFCLPLNKSKTIGVPTCRFHLNKITLEVRDDPVQLFALKRYKTQLL